MKTALTMSVVVGNRSCNNNCPICISKMTPYDPAMFQQEVDWKAFKKAINVSKQYEGLVMFKKCEGRKQ